MKNYIRTLTVLLLIVNTLFSFSQTDYKSITKAGYKYFSIKDTLKQSSCDSIRFVVRNNDSQKKPLLVFIQGSSSQSLIINDNNESYSVIESLAYSELLEKYCVVLISKPGVSVCSADKPHINNEVYTANNYKDYYVNSTIQVIHFLTNQVYVDKSKVYLIGHSQGSSIAAKIASTYPNQISKLVFMSGHVFDRHYQDITNYRKQAEYGIIASTQAQEKIDSVYNNYELLKQCVEQKSKYFENDDLIFYHYRNSYSFNFDPPIDCLLKYNNPTLVVYGTKDPAVNELDMLPLFYTRANNTNLTIHCYPNYDHNYWLREYDNRGEVVKELFNWPSVFGKVDEWLSE